MVYFWSLIWKLRFLRKMFAVPSNSLCIVNIMETSIFLIPGTRRIVESIGLDDGRQCSSGNANQITEKDLSILIFCVY